MTSLRASCDSVLWYMNTSFRILLKTFWSHWDCPIFTFFICLKYWPWLRVSHIKTNPIFWFNIVAYFIIPTRSPIFTFFFTNKFWYFFIRNFFNISCMNWCNINYFLFTCFDISNPWPIYLQPVSSKHKNNPAKNIIFFIDVLLIKLNNIVNLLLHFLYPTKWKNTPSYFWTSLIYNVSHESNVIFQLSHFCHPDSA